MAQAFPVIRQRIGQSGMAQAIRYHSRALWLILHRGPGAPPLTAGPSGMAQAFPVIRQRIGQSGMAQAIRYHSRALWLILHRGPGAPPLTAGATVGASVSGAIR
jgi:hypothetical protein